MAEQARTRSAPSRQAEEMQRRTRKERKFDQTEAELPTITQHTSFKLSHPMTAKSAAASKLADILSYLGPYNPRPLPVDPKSSVWLLDNTAFVGKDGQWQAEFLAAVFAQEPSCTVSDVVVQVADQLNLTTEDKEDAALARLEKRLRPFLQDIEPGRQVHALHGGSTKLTFSPGGRNGISTDTRKLPAAPPGMVVPTTAEVPMGVDGILQMKTFFADPEGWGLISDVDDTIKVTQTSDPIGILRTTFLDEPAPIRGMPELYAYIVSQITATSPFFYLSASPYNLYPFLRTFRDKFYPHGQLILRDASWMSIPGLLSNLTMGTEDYKVGVMHKIHGWLPKKKMICIGDSTQSDPEAYGDIYRSHPGWIKLILIRKVDDISAIGIEQKNEPQRFEKAFKDVPRSAWHVFEDPAECFKLVESATR